MTNPPKYPHTPHWPHSEGVHRDDTYHSDPTIFLGKEVVVTEKLDGGNTCLFRGDVYARSVASPTTDGWFAMVKKHHAWKTKDPYFQDIAIYGEDLYGIHTLKYYPLAEDQTFYVFALRSTYDPDTDILPLYKNYFYSWDVVIICAEKLLASTVPIVHRGVFESEKEITEFFRDTLRTPSALGPEKEGFVMRMVNGFDAEDFSKYVCKYVRKDHVQTDEHWRRNWQPCELKKR